MRLFECSEENKVSVFSWISWQAPCSARRIIARMFLRGSARTPSGRPSCTSWHTRPASCPGSGSRCRSRRAPQARSRRSVWTDRPACSSTACCDWSVCRRARRRNRAISYRVGSLRGTWAQTSVYRSLDPWLLQNRDRNLMKNYSKLPYIIYKKKCSKKINLKDFYWN